MDKNHIGSELKQAAREMQGFEMPSDIARLERKFSSAIQDILGGISDYQEVMDKLARLDEYPDAERIGKRGADTARTRYKSWRSIADDFHVLQDNMADRERRTGTFMKD